jgi:Ankyrin repeat
MIEYSIPSLLLSHGADMSGAEHWFFPSISSNLGRAKSYLSYFMHLPNAFVHIQAEFLKHPDPDGISELADLDRWLSSILYHTSPGFRKALSTSLEVIKEDLPPSGILPFRELCRELKAARQEDRDIFFGQICAFGTEDTLKPFIGSELDLPQQSLELPRGGCFLLFRRHYEEQARVFTNPKTFESLAGAGIRITDFEVVLEVMSSQFLLRRVQNVDSLETFFNLWSPTSKLRPLVLAYWLWYLQGPSMEIGDIHKALFDVLVNRDCCSFPSPQSTVQHAKEPTMFLGIEITWQVCLIVDPRVTIDAKAWVDSKERKVALLTYILDRYHPFVDLELDERWLPITLEERWVGFTPLMLAVVAGDLRVVMLLVENGASITQSHTSQNLSVLDLAHRDISFDHPRNWLGLPPSELDNDLLENYTKISKERDEAIYDYLFKRSKQPEGLALMPLPEQTSGGKLTPVPNISPLLTSACPKPCPRFCNSWLLLVETFRKSAMAICWSGDIDITVVIF